MKSEKAFYKELSFLEKNYDFTFLVKIKGIDERYIFKRNNFEIGYFSRTSQFDNTSYLYIAINGRETVLNVDKEYYKAFGVESMKNYFWKLGRIIKEQLKENRIFNYYI